jgi:hypothetical protein
MWTHTWTSFTSHTFTSLPLVHTSNPDFWGNVFDLVSYWFTSLLFIETLTCHNLRIWSSVDSRISQIPDFRISQIQDSRFSQVRDFRALQVQDSRSSQVRDFRASQVQDSRSSQVRDFRASQVQDSRSSQYLITLKTHFMNLVKLDVLRVTCFPWIPQH